MVVRFFSSIDLQSGYHQILIHPDDVFKMAFMLRVGQFQFKVLCFGLTNTQATFQRVMNAISDRHLFDWAIVSLDGISIVSKSIGEHAQHLNEALIILGQNNFQINRSKCHFFQPQVKFLGHVVSAAGLSVDPDKLCVAGLCLKTYESCNLSLDWRTIFHALYVATLRL
jgi:hypothetical protein